MSSETIIFEDLKIGTVDREAIFVTAMIRERNGKGPELSITADVRRSGHCVGGGQALDAVRAVAEHGHLTRGLTPALVEGLLDVWKRWHLNGMRAGCEHQRALGWTYNEHPSEPCPTCGYKMGTAWLHEELPADVLEFLRTFVAAGKPKAESAKA